MSEAQKLARELLDSDYYHMAFADIETINAARPLVEAESCGSFTVEIDQVDFCGKAYCWRATVQAEA